MLPSMGYFTNIPCPFFDSGLCERPHCHFRHIKKDEDINSLIPILSHSHLPNENITNLLSSSINNVLSTNRLPEEEPSLTTDLVLSQDIIFRETEKLSQNLLKTDNNSSSKKIERQIGKHFLPTANVPSYKPTPISELQKKNFLNNNFFPKQNLNNSRPSDYYSTIASKRAKLENGLEYDPEISKISSTSSLQYSPDPHNNIPNNLYTPTIITSVSPPPVDYIPSKTSPQNNEEINSAFDSNLVTNNETDKYQSTKKESKEKEGKENSKKETESDSKKKHKEKEKSKTSSNSQSKTITSKKEVAKKQTEKHSSSKHSKHKSSKSSHIKSRKSEEKDKSSKSSHKSRKSNELKKESKHYHKDKKSSSEKKSKNKPEEDRSKDSHSKQKDKSQSKSSQEKDSQVIESENDSDWDVEEINEECFKIFQEFNSTKGNDTKIDIKPNGNMLQEEQPVPISVNPSTKVRIAHQPGSNSQVFRTILPKRQPLNPSKAMIERLMKAKAKSEGESQNSAKIRIAHVPNVSLLLHAKNKLTSAVNLNRNPNPSITIAQSAPKTGRIAHLPSNDIIKKCIIIGSSRIPVNIRQRYLEILVKEYVKIYINEDESIEKAKSEETLIYNRSSTKNIYSSLMSNCISKLRKENSSKAAEGLGASTSKNVTSHSSILQGKNGQRVSWSIEKYKKPSVIDLYEALKKYQLSEDDLNLNGYPRSHPTLEACAYISDQSNPKILSCYDTRERTCDRCRSNYCVNRHGIPIGDASCVYHWGRIFNQRAIGGGRESRYSCCQSEPNESGCCISSSHVSDITDPRKMAGYVQTKSHSHHKKQDEPDVYALDCEMCYTSQGLELTRVSVVNTELVTIYETLVKPHNPVLDYNTRFSGITESDLRDISTSIKEVQNYLLKLFSNKTILIGHSLESDLKSLKIIHDTVIDTSVVFPHKMGFPKKRSLKTLTREFLSKIIQENEIGHDSAEDARSAMELMLWKIKEDLKSC